MSLGLLEATFIGTVLEGVFYGLYCIVFVMYIRVHTSKQCTDRNLLIYPISLLFVLCTAFFVLDFSQQFFVMTRRQRSQALLIWNLNTATSGIYSFIDFIAQGVLIYRCWVVWNQKWVVVVVPTALALISLATSLTLVGALTELGPQNAENRPPWFTPIGTLSFSLSLAVNTIFTGLLVLKIVKTSLAIRSSRSPGMTDVRPIISMLVESGIVFFMAQLLWVVFFSMESSGFNLFSGPITMIYGIIPTTIVVRVAMGGTGGSQTSSVESNMEFAFTDGTLSGSTKRNSELWNARLSRTEPKRTSTQLISTDRQ